MPLVAVAVAPSIFWLWFFCRRARRGEDTWKRMGALFALGVVSAGLVLAFEITVGAAAEALLADLRGPVSPVARAIFGVGLVEEAGKLAVVLLFIRLAGRPSSTTQGALWAVAAAAGFAAVENCLYLSQNGLSAIVLRGPISTFAHTLFSAVWGCTLGMYTLRREREWHTTVGIGLLTATLAHGVFNLVILASMTAPSSNVAAFLIIPLLLILYHFVSGPLVRDAQPRLLTDVNLHTQQSPELSYSGLRSRFLGTRR